MNIKKTSMITEDWVIFKLESKVKHEESRTNNIYGQEKGMTIGMNTKYGKGYKYFFIFPILTQIFSLLVASWIKYT